LFLGHWKSLRGISPCLGQNFWRGQGLHTADCILCFQLSLGVEFPALQHCTISRSWIK
jgi:hypothetical protein